MVLRGLKIVGLRMPFCWYYHRRRGVQVIASIPYEEWMREIGRRMEIGEVILLGGLMIKRARDDRVEVAVEGDGRNE